MSYPPQYPTGGVPPPMYNPLLTTMYMNQMPMQYQQPQAPLPAKSSLITKFYFMREEDNRRLKIKKTTKFKGLMLHIQRYLSPYVKKHGVKIHKLQYEDEEGLWMNFSTDNEWLECLKLTVLQKKSRVLRIRIFTVSPDQPIEDESSDDEEEEEEGEGERILDDDDDNNNVDLPPIEEKPAKYVVPKEHANKVKLLREMGFKDERRAVELLEKYDGDLQAVVKAQLAY